VANSIATFSGTPGLKLGSHPDVFSALTYASTLFGVQYAAFEYHGPADAEHVFIAHGICARTLHEAVLRLAPGAGLVVCRVLQPWDARQFTHAVPSAATVICVAQHDLFADVASSFSGNGPSLIKGELDFTPSPKDVIHLLHTAFHVHVPPTVHLASSLTKQIALWSST